MFGSSVRIWSDDGVDDGGFTHTARRPARPCLRIGLAAGVRLWEPGGGGCDVKQRAAVRRSQCVTKYDNFRADKTKEKLPRFACPLSCGFIIIASMLLFRSIHCLAIGSVLNGTLSL